MTGRRKADLIVKFVVGSALSLPMLALLDWMAVFYATSALVGDKDFVLPAIIVAPAALAFTLAFLRAYIPSTFFLFRDVLSD